MMGFFLRFFSALWQRHTRGAMRHMGYWLCGGCMVYMTLILGPADVEAAPPRTFYVDCTSGNDSNDGLATNRAWRSMNKANLAPLQPGDSLLFKRGCTWSQRLDANWVGTAQRPVLIGAYGDGTLPLIQNGLNQNVKITGAYQIIEYLRVRSDPPSVDPNCNNQPIGWTKGFNFLEGSHHNTLRYSEASNLTAGVRIATTSHHNRILYNNLHDNNVMEEWNRAAAGEDLGAWGIVINGNDNEVAYNTFSNNNALCSYDNIIHGNSVELYQAVNTNIHHNRSFGDRVFSEIGGSVNIRADNNNYAYNLHVSNRPNARFLVVRGANDFYGPTNRTRAMNNTVYLTHATGQGVICGGGCSPDILMLKNNIVWAQEKAAFADAPFTESNNIYWRTGGNPVVQFMGFSISNTSQLVDPRFMNAGANDFHLANTSTAIDRGTSTPINWGYNSDLDGLTIPQRTAVDVGAYEKP